MTLPEKALEVIKGELGKEEIPRGSNWGPHVQKYLASVGLTFAQPWCMALVYWSHDHAAKTMGVINPMLKTGHVMTQWNSRRAKYSKISPKPGDVFIMNFGKGKGHTGIVERIQGDLIYTIEGNSNDEGSREGYEVCRLVRSINKITGFLRFE